MKYESDYQNLRLAVPGRDPIAFKGGEYETTDEQEIAVLERSLLIRRGEQERPEPSLNTLRQRAAELDIDGRSSMNKDELSDAITRTTTQP